MNKEEFLKDKLKELDKEIKQEQNFKDTICPHCGCSCITRGHKITCPHCQTCLNCSE